VIETPQYDLTLFKVHFGNLTLKAYTKGEHVLRFEAIVHNTRALRCGRVLDNFPTIIGKLAAMVDRFTTTLDCVDHTFIADDLLDRLPTPTQLGATRVGGIDLNRPRIRDALAAALALSITSGGFTVAEFTTKVHTMTGHTGYTIRQAAYDLRKLRGKDLITKPGRTRRYHITPQAAGTIAALLTLRDQVIGPILAGVRSPRMGPKPITWTSVDRDYEKIRIDMQTLFRDLGIRAAAG
jgi:DNA-binding transcriptional ArsR family regulator